VTTPPAPAAAPDPAPAAAGPASAQQQAGHEQAIAAARAEGRAEAQAAAARTLAAAEFRFAAAGRIADPDAALAALDLAKLVGQDGEPDQAAIAALVESLAGPAQTAAPGGLIPAGPRAPVGAGGDWVRAGHAARSRLG
jgi:2-oxoglutarate dehydrogenase E2 component (dihydrolipoamide succinyltransferase)